MDLPKTRSSAPEDLVISTGLRAAQDAVTVQGIRDAGAVIGRRARELGFEWWAYGLRLPLPFTDPRFLLVSNYEARWVERYHEQGYLAVDPTVRHGIRTTDPQFWDDHTFRDTPELWDEARSVGLRYGWAQSCFDAQGRIGMLSLGRASEAISVSEVAQHDPIWRWLVNTAHAELSSLLLYKQTATVKLTVRQIEVLKWVADGKTSAQIGRILGMSEWTVQFHLQGAMNRLGAVNRPPAVARAASLGLLK